MHSTVVLIFTGWIEGSFRVLGQRTVAGLAAHVLVLARLLGLGNVRVAGLAGFVAGVVQRTGGDLRNRCSAVVAILSEALRHNEVADHKKDHKGDNEEKGKAEEMSCILVRLIA